MLSQPVCVFRMAASTVNIRSNETNFPLLGPTTSMAALPSGRCYTEQIVPLPASIAWPDSALIASLVVAAITQLVHHGIIYVPLGYTAADGVQFQVATAQVRFS